MSQQLDAGKLQAFLLGLTRELEAFRQFHQLLGAEHAALLDGEADALVNLAQRKNASVNELSQLADARNRYLTDTVGSTNQIGMEAWLDSHDPSDRHHADRMWRELIDLARTAKALNQRNGQMIQTQLAHNQQALAVLLGSNADTSRLYGADGQAYAAQPIGGGRPLGKA